MQLLALPFFPLRVSSLQLLQTLLTLITVGLPAGVLGGADCLVGSLVGTKKKKTFILTQMPQAPLKAVQVLPLRHFIRRLILSRSGFITISCDSFRNFGEP